MPDELAILRPRLQEVLDRAIQARAFPGCVAQLQWRGQAMTVARGQRGYQPPFGQPVDERTVYDLASLTKLWTLAATLLSLRERALSPDTPLFELLPEFGLPDKRTITLRHLMMHSSGISFAIQALVPGKSNPAQPAREPLPREEWLRRIASEPLSSAPGASVLYSCTNYFLLARALEMDAPHSPLRALLARDASPTLHPLGPPPKLIAPTELSPATGQAWLGVVHDEAARFWSSGPIFSFAGNAGLFGDISAVAGFVRLWLREEIFRSGDIERALSDTLPEGSDGTRRGWGWQIDSPLSCGRIGVDAPRGAFGHGGFTGPALWAHRATQSACIILNNRVHPSRDSPNRFPFHREVSALLGGFIAEHEPAHFDSPTPSP